MTIYLTVKLVLKDEVSPDDFDKVNDIVSNLTYHFTHPMLEDTEILEWEHSSSN